MARGLGQGRVYESPRGSRKWHVDYTDHSGQRVRKRAPGASKREARKFLGELVAERDRVLAGLALPPVKDKRLSEVGVAFRAHLEAVGRSADYQRNVRTVFKAMVRDFRDLFTREITPGKATEVRARRLRSQARGTIALHFDILRTALRWAHDQDLIPADPLARGFRPLEIRECDIVRRRRALSEDEIAALVQAAEVDDEKARQAWHDRGGRGPRPVPQAPLLTFLIVSGARWREATAIRWGDLDLTPGAGSVCFRAATTKTRRARQVPLADEELLRWLREFRGDDGADMPVWRLRSGNPYGKRSDMFRRRLAVWLARAQIPERDEHGQQVDVHGLRVTAGTRMARSGRPIQEASILLGHSDTRQTMKAYYKPVLRDLRATVEAVPAIPRRREVGSKLAGGDAAGHPASGGESAEVKRA